MHRLMCNSNPDSGFVPEMLATYSDDKNLYILLNSIVICDLESLLSNVDKMKESELSFYLGALILGLKHLHSSGVHYR